MNKNRIIELKKKLSTELQKETSDNNVILSISNELAKLDENQIRFSVDAGIINRLGKELVGRHETAVSELVKNSYDADATEVTLIFENAWQGGGTLYIQDNGHGMNHDQLINGFMRLSSSDKIHNPISPKFNRTRAGRKGIGRFATQRLGNKLTIITQTQNTEKAIKLSIDWGNFETDKDLSVIANYLEIVPKQKAEGTDLIITELREGWSDAMIKRVFRYTSDLLQPFPLSKIRKEYEENRVDPGFKSIYYRKDNENTVKIVDEEDAFLNHALAEIEGYVLNDGQGCWAVESKKLNFPQEVYLIGSDKNNRENLGIKFKFIKGIHFKAYYFIYEPSLFSPSTFTMIRELGNEKGGIRLYKNGFRVLPYGEKGNDWLGLDESTRRRAIIVPHQNMSFFGFVEIADKAMDLFEETSSREGLIENDAYKELVDFIYRSITSAVIKVADLRGRKATASQKEWKKDEEDPSIEVDNAITDLEKVITEEEYKEEDEQYNKTVPRKTKPQIVEAITKLREGREKEKQKLIEEKRKLIEEVNMLRILAGLGLVIGEFVHEVKRFLPAFDSDTRFLKNVIDELVARSRLERLEKNIKSFTKYTSYFDKAISRNVLRELEPQELRDVVNDFIEVIKNDLDRTGIFLHKPIFDGFDLFTLPMHPSEWASILFNFYTNSKKAIRRNKSSGEILIKCGREDGNVFLEFSDNGDGIPKQNEELIFNAFFTTSSAAGHSASYTEVLTSTGLGLKIVKDIAESYGGDVYVKIPDSGYNTTIRLEVPENRKNSNE